MLKWAVYGKKTQDVKISKDIETADRQPYTNGPYATRQIRRSLDTNTVKKSKKPTRYQRRSLGSAARKNLKTIDKENVNYIGNTPNYYKEGFVKKSENGFALKDVSNITPNSTPVKSNLEKPRYYLGGSKEAIPPDLPPTPPSYSRKIREAKKRKLEMATNKSQDSFIRDTVVTKSERRVNFHIDDSAKNVTPLSHSKSETSLNELSDQLEASKCSYRNALMISKQTKQNLAISTTKTLTQGLVEIEYDHDLVINCVEQPIEQPAKLKKSKPAKPSTIPIFGHHIFMENPLYFDKYDLETSQTRPIKRIRRKSSELESSFKSPTVDRHDIHALVRDGCSPASVTPLTLKLSALRFSTMSTHTKSQRITEPADITDCFSKTDLLQTDIPLSIALKDEEVSTEMENKFIFCKDSITNITESTVSTTAMGDVTLERMIEDIIKSTKKVKTKRRIIPQPIQRDYQEEAPKDIFVNSQAENKVNLIREAKYITLSRENSISPKSSPNKKNISNRRNNKMYKSLSNLPIGTVIFDDDYEYNEREVRTPDNIIRNEPKKVNLERSQSMHYSTQTTKPNLDCVSSESTPDLFSSFNRNSNILRRQKCIRRKKSTVSNESSWRKQQSERQSILTLENCIPSPCTVELNMSICDPRSASLNCIPGSPCDQMYSPNLNSSLIYDEPYPERNKRSRELFGLTLENGIPSPITPVSNLKRPSCNLSEERAHKTSKLDEDIIKNTPILEHKPSRRCLTFSPEEGSINSNEEKRRSVASNRLERSCERYQLKGTIDLEVFTRNKMVDVHVIRCRDLQRLCGRTDDINAYAKVVISGVNENQSLASQRSIFQRTSVLYGKREPEFQRHLRLPLPNIIYDQQMLHISVWHRDKIYRRSEFLGCVSFPIKDAIKSDISGTYYLQSQVSGRTPSTHASTTAPGDKCPKGVSDEARVTIDGEGKPKMATDNIDASTNEESNDNHIEKGLSSNGLTASVAGSSAQAVAAAFQKEADDHLFLRYLELDPPEDPAAPKKSQRHGRTPFTTTRKLSRGSSGGFGFTLVWTRPPRVERVAAGGSAERAGLRAGDYIVFVGSKNVVTANEEEVRNIIKSSGQVLQIETFRRIPQNGIGARPRVSQVEWQIPSETASPPAHISTPIPAPRSPRAAPASPVPAARPPTACSSTSQSLDRRKLHLPQVTFSKETTSSNTDGRKRALLAVVTREQHFTSCLQFGVVRFVSPLVERADLIQPSDHQLLFQNIEEILRLSEDILDQVVQEDGEILTSTVVAVYLQKTPLLLSLYKKYCLGLKRADCVLVKKSKDPSGAFTRFCTSPPIPRRKPDITSLIHKPLEQFRELLRLMRAAAASKGAGPYEQLEKKQLQIIAEQLQNVYQDVTAGSGLMGLAGDGKPLLSVSDLESRLVFTRCKPFVLSTGGRQWIFGGELSRVDGRSVRPYWALLFTDLLLFATVSRDRVLFVTEEPVSLATVSEAQFNVRKKATEFRLILGRAGGESPLVSCAPRTTSRARTVVLRAPSMDLKAVWQSLLQRQIYRAHTMSGTPLGSPLDSPDPHLSFSLATLDSQQRQTRRSSAEASGTGAGGSTGADGVRSQRSRGSSLHLQRWMTQLPEAEEFDKPEVDLETWSVEELRKRSKELNLLDVAAVNKNTNNNDAKVFSPADKKETERSPSKSSNSGSQITVRTSPVVVDTIPVCKQCHQKCLSKPNSPLISQKKPPKPKPKPKPSEVSPQTSNSNKSSNSICSANCGNRKQKNFNICHLERKGAMKILRPEDAPKAALKVIDSIEQSQKMLKSTSYELKTDSPILSRSIYSNQSKSPNKSQLELKREFCNSGRSPSPCSSSRNNSPLSTSHTTCSSMVLNSSSNDLRMSNSNINQVQCVIAQEKYLNEVKCVENITVSRNRLQNNANQSPGTIRKEQLTRQKAENVLNKVLGMNIITKRENFGTCLNTSSVFLEDNSVHDVENEVKIERGLRRSPRMGISAVTKMNGDVKKTDLNSNSNKGSDVTSDDDLELGPLMLMGLSAINPTAHLLRVEPFKRSTTFTNGITDNNSDISVPNIAVVPPTPDFISCKKTDDLLDDSPDSPLPEEPPYVSLKRYGTLSSLERFPSDETDDGNVRVTAPENDGEKSYNQGGTTGIMGWTARAGSFVVEKMNIFNYSDNIPNQSLVQKQPSFLERCLGVSDWKGSINNEDGTGEPGEGSGASGEEAWGTPSSGDLSDNLPDSEHGTLSSPTKSSSSYAGDDDTELMMDELLMAPTITGPTTLRPLLPRRRLEPLLEEDYSDSESEDNKPTPTNPESQDSARGLFADVCCAAPCRHPSALDSGAGGEGAVGAQFRGDMREGGPTGGDVCVLNHSPDRTPTNEMPSLSFQSVLREYTEVRSGAVAAAGVYARQGSASTASTPSTLDRTAIHNPSTPPNQDPVTSGTDQAQDSLPVSEEELKMDPAPTTPPEERLSPRAEMRLALDQGKDMLAEQEAPWAGVSDPWLWRAACQRSLLRRVASADTVTLSRPPAHLARRTAPHTTSRNSVYAWKAPENEKLMEMEQLARVEVQTMRSRTRSQCQNGKILGFLRRRASSDSPRRELTSFGAPRPFSPRRSTEKQDKRFWKQVSKRRQSCGSINQD